MKFATILTAAAVMLATPAMADNVLSSETPSCGTNPVGCDTFDIDASQEPTLEDFLVFASLKELIDRNGLPDDTPADARLPHGTFTIRLLDQT